VALVAVAATALAGVVTARVADRNAVDQARDAAVGAAVGNVATVLSYDYRHLDQDFAAADRLLSPKFRKKYDSTTAKGVRPLAVRYKTITTADVSAAGVIDVSANRALVLVFVNQTSTNTQLAAPRLDRSRIRVSLVRTGGHWLIDDLQPI